MSDIQRWQDNWYGADHGEMTPGDAGEYVKYTAHVQALDAAVQRVEAIADDMNSGVDWHWDYDIDPTGMTRNPRVWIREAVAAIRNEVK
jgi:hypothetical protein